MSQMWGEINTKGKVYHFVDFVFSSDMCADICFSIFVENETQVLSASILPNFN